MSPLQTFAGLLDRSVQEIATLVADARTFDASRIGRIADIWDNNTFPLVSAACAPRPLRAWQARAGLLWMADLGASRRALMVDLDPSLDTVLPAAMHEPSVYRDYQARVCPGSFPVTAEIVAGLAADYDLPAGSVQSLAVQTTETGLQVQLTIAAPRRFVPGTGRVARDGTQRSWPAAPLKFTFTDAVDLRFDAEDRVGVTVASADADLTVAIGHGGSLRAASASVWPHDPVWYESAAGHRADAMTPLARQPSQEPVRASRLTAQARAAAGALVDLMVRIRLVHYYPALAARVPAREICRVTAGAGSAILAAAAKRGLARRRAFAELGQRWRRVPPDLTVAPIPSGLATLRYAAYEAPHEEYDIPRQGSAVLVAAVPNADPAAPWHLVSEEIAGPVRFRSSSTAFDGVQHIQRSAGTLTIGDNLAIHPL